MPIITLEMPRLVGSRESATVFTSELPLDLTHHQVTVSAAKSVAAPQSFADELVKRILVTRQADHLTVENPSIQFAKRLIQSADVHGVQDKLAITMS